jgi:hypothetical protein
MAIFSRILNVLIFLLAIGAAVGAYVLAEKRKELLGRGDKLAERINMVAKELDKGSGTNEAAKLAVDKMNRFLDLDSVLPTATKQAQSIIAQRGELGNTLNKIAETLRAPDFRASDFENVNTFNEKDQLLVDATIKTVERADTIAKEVAKNGETLGVLVDENSLKTENYRDAIDKFTGKVNFVKEKHDKLVSHAKGIAQTLGLKVPELGGEDYPNVLQTTHQEVMTFKETADQTKADLNLRTSQLAQAQKELEKAVSQVGQLEAEKKTVVGQLELVKRDLDMAQKTIKELTGGSESDDIAFTLQAAKNLYKKLRGSVVSVNRKWGYVVLDLGKKNEVEQELKDGEKKTVTGPLPPDKDMIVARGIGEDNKYVAKIRVTRVLDNCAIASVLPGLDPLSVQVGDVVFFGEEKEEVKEVETPTEAPKPAVEVAEGAAPAAGNGNGEPVAAEATEAPATEPAAAPATAPAAETKAADAPAWE